MHLFAFVIEEKFSTWMNGWGLYLLVIYLIVIVIFGANFHLTLKTYPSPKNGVNCKVFYIIKNCASISHCIYIYYQNGQSRLKISKTLTIVSPNVEGMLKTKSIYYRYKTVYIYLRICLPNEDWQLTSKNQQLRSFKSTAIRFSRRHPLYLGVVVERDLF